MILVTGATGYVGREVVAHLTDHGRPVRALVRSQHAVLPPGVELAVGDVTDPSSLRAAMGGAEAIVHLVAILDGTDEQFEAINHHGTRNLVAAAQHHGVRRFLHMSAVGVDEEHAPLTRYWRTKYAAKQAVMESGLDWTIMQPSFVFGRGGGALAAFERLLRLPVTPVIGDGRYRHQPVWVGDVAAAFLAALNRPQTAGQTYELGGPQVFEFNDLLDELARVTGRKPHPKLHLPAGLMKLQSAVLQHFPEPLRVTREQIVMLMAGTECDIGPMRSQLGIEPASLAEAYTR
ncbi:MAG: complex I NDUFA9 subunit family protein [Gaiellales bacterium]